MGLFTGIIIAVLIFAYLLVSLFTHRSRRQALRYKYVSKEDYDTTPFDSVLDENKVDFSSPFQYVDDEFDKRMEALRLEIEYYNSSPSNAVELDSNVKNLPHASVDLQSEYYPVVEEEKEATFVEFTK